MLNQSTGAPVRPSIIAQAVPLAANRGPSKAQCIAKRTARLQGLCSAICRPTTVYQWDTFFYHDENGQRLGLCLGLRYVPRENRFVWAVTRDMRSALTTKTHKQTITLAGYALPERLTEALDTGDTIQAGLLSIFNQFASGDTCWEYAKPEIGALFLTEEEAHFFQEWFEGMFFGQVGTDPVDLSGLSVRKTKLKQAAKMARQLRNDFTQLALLCDAVPVYRWPMVAYAVPGPVEGARYLGAALHYNPRTGGYTVSTRIEVLTPSVQREPNEITSLLLRYPDSQCLTAALATGESHHEALPGRHPMDTQGYPQFKAAPSFNASLERYMQEVER